MQHKRLPSQRTQLRAQSMADLREYETQPVNHVENVKAAFLIASQASHEILDGIVIPVHLWEALDTAIDNTPPKGFASVANRIVPA